MFCCWPAAIALSWGKETAASDGSQGALISESWSLQELMGESPEKGKNNPRTQVSDDLKQMTKQMTGPVDDSSFSNSQSVGVFTHNPAFGVQWVTVGGTPVPATRQGVGVTWVWHTLWPGLSSFHCVILLWQQATQWLD